LTPSRAIVAAAALACLAALTARPAGAQVLRFEVNGSVFSPDGDGTQDTTRVVYALADSVLALSVVVFEADSTTPVDTLRAPLPDRPAGNRTLVWKGRKWDGSPAPEGSYIVTLRAVGVTPPDVVRSLPVFVDLTPPSIQILSAVPDPYAPGAPGAPASLSISFVVADASPVSVGRPPDELTSAFTDPAHEAVDPASLTTTPPFTGGSGAYIMAWNAASQVTALADGEYGVTLTVNDVAGYTNSSTYHFEIDTRAPEVKATSLTDNSVLRVPPDSLDGYAYDARGIDSLAVKYAAARPYQPVTSVYVRDDSLRFAVPLADSVAAEGQHRLYFRAVDGVGRTTVYQFTVTVDLTAPAPPALTPFDGKSYGSTYMLSGTYNDGGDTRSVVRILRNGEVVDSLTTLVSKSPFTTPVRLLPGRNELVAVLRDGAFNASAPSNTVVVRFESGAGLFMPVPFTPGASFDLNAPRAARGAAVRVYDVTGDLVARFEDAQARQFYSFPWDGLNGSGIDTKKGPLVAVASLDYDDGTRDVFRKVFLFDPGAP
jgi:hypothetical protein